MRRTGAGLFLSIVAALMMAAAIPAASAMRWSDGRTDARAESLRREGQDAVADVVRVREVGKNKEPRVAYSFGVGDSRYFADVRAPRAVWSDLREGGHLTVRYLPDDPAVNYPAGWEPSRLGPGTAALVASLLLAIGGFLWFSLRRERRLLEQGVPAPAVVTRSHRVKGGYTARYRFRADDGEVRKGRGSVRRVYPPGETITVVVHPDNPRRNAPYPMKLHRVADAEGA